MINKKEIILFTCLLTFSFWTHNNKTYGSVFSILLMGIVLFTFFVTGSIKKTFYMHLLFMLSSVETVFYDVSGEVIMYSYKHFELPYIPIAASTIITIIIFFVYLITSKTFFYNRKYKSNSFIIVLFLLPLFTGLVGIMSRGYKLGFFLSAAMLPTIALLAYSILNSYVNENDIIKLKSLIVSSLIGSLISSFLAGFLGVASSYGGNITLPYNQILLFCPFLMIFSIYANDKEKKYLFFLGLLSCVQIVLFNSSGKGILFVFFALLLYFYKMASDRKQYIKFVIILIIISICGIFAMRYALENSNLFKYKLTQVLSLLKIFNFSLGSLEEIPISPRIRIIETINIFLSLKNNVIDLIVGRGFGGYFTDQANLFVNIDLSKGAFSEIEIMTAKFYNPHESWNEILLATGFTGLVLWIKEAYRLLRDTIKDNDNSIYALVTFIFVFLMWNTYTILTYYGVICLYCYNYNKYTKINNNR